MGEVWFYHLTESPAEAVLPVLLARALGSGKRIELRGSDAARMEKLDQSLWLGAEEGFLPHGIAGGPHDALQPVLLTTGAGAANTPAFLMVIDSAVVTPDEVAALERVFILFDGHDDPALAAARDQWRQMTAAGLAAQYWAQEDGRWVKKQERPARDPG